MNVKENLKRPKTNLSWRVNVFSMSCSQNPRTIGVSGDVSVAEVA